jgi:hypothetical protein
MRISTVLRTTGIAICALTMATVMAAPPVANPSSGDPTQWAPLQITTPQFTTPQGASPWTALEAAAPQWIKYHVSLSGEDALSRLRVSNPRHYAIAVQVLAAANEICNATKTGPVATKFDAKDVFCAQRFWATSNPPKRYLQFRIDDTAYSALVVTRIAAPTLDDGPAITAPR